MAELEKTAKISTPQFCLLLAIITFVVYFPSLSGGFIIDDEALFVRNPQMASSYGLERIWTTSDNPDYWPLTYTSLWVQYQFFANNPMPYRVVNLLVHILNALLLLLLLQQLKIPGAWIASALFALHPMNVETVAWISELKNTQSTLFFLLATLAFLRFQEGRARAWYLLSILLFLGALLSKSSTVVLPVVLLLILWWMNRTLTRRDFLLTTPFFAFAVANGLLAIHFQNQGAGGGVMAWNASFASTLILAGKNFWFYLGKILMPIELNMSYPNWDLDSSDLAGYLPGGAAVLFLASVFLGKRVWIRSLAFCTGCYSAMIFPVLGFVPLYAFWFAPVTDRWSYLAILAPLSGMAALLSGDAFPRAKKALLAVTIALLTALAIMTGQRAALFQDPELLWQDTLDKNPKSALAHGSLGVLMGQKGDLIAAQKHYELAVQYFPRFVVAKSNLGHVLWRQGKPDQAAAVWMEILRFYPTHSITNKNLADLRLSQGNIEEAVARYRLALERLPHWVEARNYLAIAYSRQRNFAVAESELREVIRLQPNYTEAYSNLGNVLAEQKRYPEALAAYREALKIETNYAEAAVNVALTLGLMGRFDDAITSAKFAIEMLKQRKLENQIPRVERMIETFKEKRPYRDPR